jgi:hypothetical protein
MLKFGMVVQKEMPIEVLGVEDRRQLFKHLIESRAKSLNVTLSVSTDDIFGIADACHGFSPYVGFWLRFVHRPPLNYGYLLCSNSADLEALARSATLKASLKAAKTSSTNSQPTRTAELSATAIRQEKNLTKPVSVQRFAPTVPNVHWNDIGGLADVKNKLKQATVWLYRHKEVLRRLGIQVPRGVLLYGPPGTGKTLLAKAVATESSANFISVNIGEILKSEVGESEKTVAEIFRTARRSAPSIIFFDEFQALFGNRDAAAHYEKSVRKRLVFPASYSPSNIT